MLALFQFSADAFRSETFPKRMGIYGIQWAVEDAVPDVIRRTISDLLVALATNGNGACAMHSVFGFPSVTQEFFAGQARERAAHYLSTLVEASRSNAAAAGSLQSIRSSLWNEFVLPVSINTPTPEANIFWQALGKTASELQAEARRHVYGARLRANTLDETSRRAVIASRSLFS